MYLRSLGLFNNFFKDFIPHSQSLKLVFAAKFQELYSFCLLTLLEFLFFLVRIFPGVFFGVVYTYLYTQSVLLFLDPETFVLYHH